MCGIFINHEFLVVIIASVAGGRNNFGNNFPFTSQGYRVQETMAMHS